MTPAVRLRLPRYWATPANIARDERTRAVAWLVVSVIIAGTGISGAALLAAAPWLFYTGVGIVVLGIVWGRAVHAMRDQTQIRSNQL